MTTNTDFAITTDGLSKHFGDLTAVNNLSLEIPKGGVIGFVGPNGSGKSTTIRVLLGLLSASSGTGTVLGSPIERPQDFAHKVGALVENPAFVGSLSAKDNLRSLAALRSLPNSRVAEVLDTVGLTGRENDRASKYSLGMKQRLGIAAALLPDPELLILDEPTNGLDPAGIVEIRMLLRQLAAEGRTVIVSSHLLSEIQAACDDLVVIRAGHLLYNGSLDGMMDQAEQHVDASPALIEDIIPLAELYRAQGWKTEILGSTLRLGIPATQAASANHLAAESQIYLKSLIPVQETLEDLFLKMTGTVDGELSGHDPDTDPFSGGTKLTPIAA